ncbi:unnamed protein product [Acanthocheilonema viteae]|uniref:Uncharacterized protein n=1 Tax=Acanthocheilonema viteae TaxID=6277 RepID=A0A498SYL1_ACAVI|nr:unnamed protein product [Acanthocheilonema viteae]
MDSNLKGLAFHRLQVVHEDIVRFIVALPLGIQNLRLVADKYPIPNSLIDCWTPQSVIFILEETPLLYFFTCEILGLCLPD